MKQKLLIVFLFSIAILSCSNPSLKENYEMKQKWEEANRFGIFIDSIDVEIHQYNVTHDSTWLHFALFRLGKTPQNDEDKLAYLQRKLSVLRLLHEYDSALSVLDTYPNTDFELFGKKKQSLITEISQYNYYHQYDGKNQKITELVTYMEYCFERQKLIYEGNESKYLQKYKNNQLALDAVPTKVNASSLNLYMVARLLRGDNKTELEVLINDYYKKGVICDFEQEMLLHRLNGDYIDKDFDMVK